MYLLCIDRLQSLSDKTCKTTVTKFLKEFRSSSDEIDDTSDISEEQREALDHMCAARHQELTALLTGR